MADVARIQDEKGYMIEYEKTPEGHYEITNYNCPILNIASTYKQLCSNEKKVLSEIFSESNVISKTCITRGDNFCKWIITKPKTKNENNWSEDFSIVYIQRIFNRFRWNDVSRK